MTLALRLGRTLHELKSTLTASELKLWMEYDKLSPIGDRRGDRQAAQITAAIFNAKGGNVSIEDATIQWNVTVEETEDISALEGFLGKLAD
ncbi:DUF4035 domain-containing protein [Rouxiella badensis]|uniref:DUF4035 domain-containing protein n=1 Tax=Rouxiella silvae TaxID=1646373 RepID=A0AA41BX74_9GAMM|nr:MULTISPECIES: DUF4035 domain-containing protein [Rouxiella]MBF6637905.1 DUF4035 domain-containing protein [Rouxiella silvae]MCC3735453.1 DUF4035 domain-containing protein [Rouxiella badensis]MCC3760750.1 DUF4035 domain-containing protein [Rouxiella badensis]